MSEVRIVEVGPRDGLQNESTPLPTDVKLRLIASLAEAGLREIEATSFVSPKWVPQLGDAAEVWRGLPEGPLYSALVPNPKGLQRAMEVGVRRIAVFTGATDAFVHRNLNMTVAESLTAFREVVQQFRHQPSTWIRGYVSVAFECPYSGPVAPAQVVDVAQSLVEMGVDEFSIGDTIGVAVPMEVKALTRELLEAVSPDRIAYHFHDTRGTALANVQAALDMGIRAFDSSAGGLGGCPFAPGAGGNLATEDLVYLLERSGIATHVDPDRLARASLEVLGLLGRSPSARAQVAALGGDASCPK